MTKEAGFTPRQIRRMVLYASLTGEEFETMLDRTSGKSIDAGDRIATARPAASSEHAMARHARLSCTEAPGTPAGAKTGLRLRAPELPARFQNLTRLCMTPCAKTGRHRAKHHADKA
jgi:hypothetical protein